MFNPAVHSDLLVEIWELERDGVCQKDIIDRLRPLTVIQRIGRSTRCGGPDRLKLERFDESTQLTFPAFTGQRKQSIRDVENHSLLLWKSS